MDIIIWIAIVAAIATSVWLAAPYHDRLIQHSKATTASGSREQPDWD